MNEPWLADISDAFAVQHDSGEHTVVKDEAVNNVDIEEMIQNMTLSDLIGQMSQIDICQLVYANATTSGGTTNNVTAILNQTALDYYIGTIGIGSVYNLIESRVGLTTKASWTALTYRSIMIQIQNTARRYHRPPVLWGLDSIHGGNFIHGATVSPQPLNIAATFNRTTAHVVGQMSSRDTRAAGVQWIFTPLLGLGLEPRWSRFYETFGEDPLVVGVMASQMIQGIQQYTDDKDNNNNNNSTNNNIVAVVAQAPFLRPASSNKKLSKRRGQLGKMRLALAALQDAARGYLGLSPAVIPILGLRGQLSMMPTTPEALDFYLSLHPSPKLGGWINRAPVRGLLEFKGYKPLENVRRQPPRIPVLLISGSRDAVCPAEVIDEVDSLLPHSSVITRNASHVELMGPDHAPSVSEDMAIFYAKAFQ